MMYWNDDDLERDILYYSEIQTVQDSNEVEVPETIRKYRSLLEANNAESIFDANYYRTTVPHESENLPTEDDDLLSEDNVIRVISGRGRGGGNEICRPGARTRDETEIINLMRQVAPLGYGNEITESIVRAHRQQSKTSKKLSPGNSSHSPKKNKNSSKRKRAKPSPSDSEVEFIGQEEGTRKNTPPIPMSQILKKARESRKLAKQDIASQEKIKEILEQDVLEAKLSDAVRNTEVDPTKRQCNNELKSEDFPPLKTE